MKARFGNITRIELNILLAIARTASQNKAAAELGISVPVLNKRLAGISKKAGEAVFEANTLHTNLTEAGKRLMAAYERNDARMQDLDRPVIGASMLTQPYLMLILDRRAHLCISTDELNLAFFKMGLLDVAVLDDPEALMGLTWKEHSNLVERTVEVGSDELLHMRRGPRYIRFSSGAQGLGFRYLERSGAPHKVVECTRDPHRLFASGLSFFLNRRIYDNAKLGKDLDIGPADRSELESGQGLVHTITAVVLKRAGRPEEEVALISRTLSDLSVRFKADLGTD